MGWINIDYHYLIVTSHAGDEKFDDPERTPHGSRSGGRYGRASTSRSHTRSFQRADSPGSRTPPTPGAAGHDRPAPAQRVPTDSTGRSNAADTVR